MTFNIADPDCTGLASATVSSGADVGQKGTLSVNSG